MTTRRRRPIGRPIELFAVAILASGLLAGCAQSNAPSGYDDATRTNFIDACTGKGTDQPGSSEETCVCVYEWISVNVPFDSKTQASAGNYAGPDFMDLDKTLRDDPEKFPEEIATALAAECPGWGASDGGSVAPGTSIVVDTTEPGGSPGRSDDDPGTTDTTV